MTHRFFSVCFLLASLWQLIIPELAPAADPAYAPLRGRWQVVELVDDGRVIPQEAIDTWIPVGDEVEVIDNAIVFTSPADGQRHVRTFSVDATRYPFELDIQVEGRPHAHGIYQIDKGRLVICATPARLVARPTDFSAPAQSKRVLLVLQRMDEAAPTGVQNQRPATPATSASPATLPLVRVPVSTTAASTAAATKLPNLPPPPDLRNVPGSTGKVLTDAEVRQLLLGTWKYRDAYGDFFLTLEDKGTFNTYRESATTSAFQQMFVRAPVSSGTWVLYNWQLTLKCNASVQRDRINQHLPVAVRSVSANDLIYVDQNGQVGKAVKVR